MFMADKKSVYDTIRAEIPNIDIRPKWTQSDEFATYVECLQKARHQITNAMGKFTPTDDRTDSDARKILQKLHLNTCVAIAEIDTLRERTKVTKCMHASMLNDKCQICGRTIYYE